MVLVTDVHPLMYAVRLESRQNSFQRGVPCAAVVQKRNAFAEMLSFGSHDLLRLDDLDGWCC